MYHPLRSSPVPHDEVPFFDKLYMHLGKPANDPAMTWGTVVDVTNLQSQLREASARLNVMLSPAHVLVKAVAMALVEHPHLRRRVVGRRLYNFKHTNVLLSFQNPLTRAGDVMYIRNADQLSLPKTAAVLWHEVKRARRGEDPTSRAKRNIQRLGYRPMGWMLRTHRWLNNRFRMPVIGSRLARYNASPVLINCLNYPGAPPLRYYKATGIGANSWAVHVAMGPVEKRAIVVDDDIVIRPMMPLFIRTDHRLGDAIVLGRFVETVRAFMSDPRTIPGHGLDDDMAPRQPSSPLAQPAGVGEAASSPA